MTQAASINVSSSRSEPMCSPEQASSFTPAQIRQAIAHWVGEGRMDMAESLVAAGLAIHPESEDILAIAALLAEMNQDWAQAQDCLEHLLSLQGEAAGPDIHYHLVRVMRCRAAYHRALLTAREALAKHPEHPGLKQECIELADLLGDIPVLVQAVAHSG